MRSLLFLVISYAVTGPICVLLMPHTIFPFTFTTEFTTMAGRRLRDAVKTVLTSGGTTGFGSNVHVVLAGLTNTYSQYVTTFEEYQIQRYEVS